MRPYRYLTDRDRHRRSGRLGTAAATAAILVHLLFAQLTLVVAAFLLIIGRLGRWRLSWLWLPGACGLIWALGVGARSAIAGYLAAAWQLTGHLTGHLTGPGAPLVRMAGLRGVVAAWPRWLPAQLPLAAAVAAAEAAAVSRLVPGAGPAPATYRPGLVVAARRAYLAAAIRRGELATGDGGCVGIVASTGQRAAVSWAEAESGVLCSGSDPAAVTGAGLDLAIAAIQHRKTVIIVDFGGTGMLRGIEPACTEAGAPLVQLRGRDELVSFPAAAARRDVVLCSPAAAPRVLDDLTAALADRRSLGAQADCLIWVDGCGAVEQPAIQALRRAAGPGVAVVLGAAEGQAAAALAALVNVIVVAGRAPAELGSPHAAGGHDLPAGLLRGRQPDDLAVFTRSTGCLRTGQRVAG